jgi:hypothetical protein
LRKFRHRFELRLAIIAAIALLIAQVGATAHAYSHDAAAGAAASHRSAANSHDLCNDCLAYAPLLSAAAAPSALPFLRPQGPSAAMRVTADSLVERSPTLAFRSRAPPYTT